MRENFVWLETPYDVAPVAEKLNRPWSEIESILLDDWREWQRSVFHIPSGRRKTYSQLAYRKHARLHLERHFFEELWDTQIEWDSVVAEVKVFNDSLFREHMLFRIEAFIDGLPRYSSFRIPLEELNDKAFPENVVYRDILNRMVHFMDSRIKEERYGPRR